MSREQSDGEDDVVGTEVDRLGDATVETKVELRLPFEAGMEPDQTQKDILIPPAVGMDVVMFWPGRAEPTRVPRRGQAEVGQIPSADTLKSETPWAVTGDRGTAGGIR